MNGTVTVLCKKHGITCQLKDGRPYHRVWGAAGFCDSKWFTVRRERQVGVESAVHELTQIERARGEDKAIRPSQYPPWFTDLLEALS